MGYTDVQAIDNTNLRTLGGDFAPGFTPAVNFVWDKSAKTVAVTDATVYPSGDPIVKIKVRISDSKGKELSVSIVTGSTSRTETVDIQTLDVSRGIVIVAQVITTKNLTADGGAYDIRETTGSLGKWAIRKNAVVA